LRNKQKNHMELVFFHHCRENPDSDGWRYKWLNLPFRLKIVSSDTDKTGRVDVYNPRIHWVAEARPKPSEYWVELPNLYHIPIRGKRYSELVISQDEHVRLAIRDHGWVYRFGEGRDVSMDHIFLENQGDALWKGTFESGISRGVKDLSAFHKRIFCTACIEMGEWRLVSEVAPDVWNGDYLGYILAIASYHQRRRLPERERDALLRDELLLSGAWIEALVRLLELQRKYPEWDVRTTMIPIMTGEKMWPVDVLSVPSGTCIRESALLIDCVARDFLRIVQDDVFRGCRASFLYRCILETKDRSIRNDVLNGSVKWYTPLTTLPGAEKGEILFSQDDRDYVASSSSVLVYPENPAWYIVNVRRVNYRIQENGSYISIVNGQVSPYYNGITKNEFYFMDRETLQPVSDICSVLDDEIPGRRASEVAIVGIEDVRLVESEGKILFYGVTKSHSYTDAIRIIQGTYDVATSRFRETRVLRPPYEENSCEKNWAWYADNRYIYRWYPVEIGYVNTATNSLVVDERIQSPGLFQEFRGSSPGVRWKGYTWFTVHSVHYIGGQRKYVHYLVVLDLDSSKKSIVAITEPFLFEELQIEYTVGLDISDGRILFLYSTRDATSRYVRIPMMIILKRLHVLDPSRETAFYRELLSH